MKAVNLFDYLSGNEYPGRGIAVGRTPCGKKMRIAYFIMGRSENSRNRIFVTEGEGIRTEAYDPSPTNSRISSHNVPFPLLPVVE